MSAKNEIKNIIDTIASDKHYSDMNSRKLNMLFESYFESAPDFTANELSLEKLKKEFKQINQSREIVSKKIKFASAFLLSSAAAAVIIFTLMFGITEKPQTAVSVAMYTGKVSVIRYGTSIDLGTGSNLIENDIIVTDSNSSIDLEAGDTRVRVTEKSIVALSKILLSKNKNHFSSFLKSGSLIMIVNRLRPDDRVTVKTNTSVAAVRGTVFGVKVTENGTVKYEVFEGKVKVKNSVPGNISDESLAGQLDDYFEKNSVIIGQNESCKVEDNNKFLSSISRENFKEVLGGIDLLEPVSSDIEPLDLSSGAAGFIKNSSISEMVQIKIKTVPESAEIKIDGSSRGIGSSELILKKGLHSITISADGYKPETIRRNFTDRGNEITVSLDKIIPASTEKQLSSLSSDYILSDNARGLIVSVSREGIIHASLNEKIIWTLSLKNRVSAQPVILNSILFVPTYDEIISAVDVSNGNIQWKRIYTGRVQEYPGMVPENGYIDFATSKNTLLRIDRSGRIISEFKFNEPVVSFFSGKSMFVFAALESGLVYGIDRIKNLKVIKTDFKEKIINMNLVGNNLILVSISGNITAYDFKKDQVAWKYSSGDIFNSGAVFDDEFIYIPGLSGTVYKIDSTGALIWKCNSGSRSSVRPVIDSDNLYIAGSKTVAIIDKATGEVSWSLVVADVISKNIAVSDKNIHLVLDKKGLVSLKK